MRRRLTAKTVETCCTLTTSPGPLWIKQRRQLYPGRPRLKDRPMEPNHAIRAGGIPGVGMPPGRPKAARLCTTDQRGHRKSRTRLDLPQPQTPGAVGEVVNWPGYRLTTYEPGQRFVTVMTAVGLAGVGEFGEVSAGGGEAGTALDGAGHGDAGSRCVTSGHRQHGLSYAGGLLAGRVQVAMTCAPGARFNRPQHDGVELGAVAHGWPPFSSNQPSSRCSTTDGCTGIRLPERRRGGRRGRRHAGGIDRGRWRRRW